MRQHIIALVDCDCFYVSCERKDNPDLQGKPVCVMTGGGDKGIIVSRAKEAMAFYCFTFLYFFLLIENLSPQMITE